MLRKIEATRRQAEKIRLAKEQNDKRLQDMQRLDGERSQEVLAKKLKVVEDRAKRMEAEARRKEQKGIKEQREGQLRRKE